MGPQPSAAAQRRGFGRIYVRAGFTTDGSGSAATRTSKVSGPERQIAPQFAYWPHFRPKKPGSHGCAHRLDGIELGCVRDYPERSPMIDRIAVDPKIHFGKPHVVGTRITVQNVLELVENGVSFERIIQDYYPDLKTEDIHACLRYAIALVAAEDIHLNPAAA